VLKEIIKWIPVLAWVLCACTVTASVDRLPDPPATKPQVLGVSVFSVGALLQGPAHRPEAPLSSPSWIVRCLFPYQISERIVGVRPVLMQYAADVSPPKPVSNRA
jgi:hypothetical protein